MKKKLILIIIFAVAAGILSGCSPGGTPVSEKGAVINPPDSPGDSDISPENRAVVDGLFREAEKMAEDGRHREALKIYDKILSIDSKSIKALESKADIYLRLREWKNLEDTVTKLLTLDPENVNGLLCRAGLYKEKGDMKGFLNDRIAAQKASPLTVRTNIELGRAFSETGSYEKADEVLDRAFKMSPTAEEQSALYTAKTYTALHRKLHKEAEEYARKVISLGKHKAHGYFLMMEVCMDTDRREMAWEMYQNYKKEDPSELLLKQQGPRMRGILHNSLGTISRSRFRYDDALRHYDEAVKLDPKNAGFMLNRIITLAEMGKQKEAAKVAEQWGKLSPAEPTAAGEMADYAVAFQMMGNTEKALIFADKAIKNDPQDSYLLANRALINFYAKDEAAYKRDMARFEKTASPPEKAHVAKIMKQLQKAGPAGKKGK